MGFRIILVLCLGTFISHSCAVPAFDYSFEDEGAPNDYTMNKDAPNGYTMNKDAPNGYTTNKDAPNGYTMNNDAPNGYTMDEGAPNDYTMDEDAPRQELAEESAGPVTYKYEWTDKGKKHEEQITIDKSKQTEKIHVNPDEESDETDILSDFKRKLTMYRFPASGICLLATLDEQNKVPPNKLADDLEKATKRQNPTSQEVIYTYTDWYGDELLSDRSVLSKEMIDLCANIPIYKIEKNPSTPGREKRAGCRTHKKETNCRGCGFLWLGRCCDTETFTVCD